MGEVQDQARDELAVVTAGEVEVGVATVGPVVEVEVAGVIARRVAEAVAEEEEDNTPGAEEAVVVVEDLGHIR